jgi:hypothetical protein
MIANRSCQEEQNADCSVVRFFGQKLARLSYFVWLPARQTLAASKWCSEHDHLGLYSWDVGDGLGVRASIFPMAFSQKTNPVAIPVSLKNRLQTNIRNYTESGRFPFGMHLGKGGESPSRGYLVTFPR